MEDNKELFAKIKYLINKKKDLVAICKELNLKDYEIIGLVQLMKQDGELVDYLNGEIIKLKEPQKNNDTFVVPNNMEKIRLLFISDTHFGSKYDRPDIIRYVIDKAQRKNVSAILHFGDLTDGYYQNRQQHVYELKKIGADEQADYFVNTYPKSNIPTYAIGGN